MTCSLSFSPEFYLLDGEPYDSSGPQLNIRKQPCSLWSALLAMSPDDQAGLRRDLFPRSAVLTWDTICEMLLDRVQQVDTCTTLESPVEVWLDRGGDWRVLVHDGPPAPSWFPSPDDVARALVEHTSDLPHLTDADDPHDVRLQVHADGWAVHVGDPSYDPDHHGHWGATAVDGPVSAADADELALDLLDQCLDGHYS